MDILHAGANSVFILIGSAEAEELGLSGDGVTAEAAARITDSLPDSVSGGREVTGIEAFSGFGGLMLAVYFKEERPVYFVFRDAGSLALAARACPGHMRSAVSYHDGAYILETFPGKDGAPAALYEYGRRADFPDGYTSYLREHGKPVAGPYALDVFRLYL